MIRHRQFLIVLVVTLLVAGLVVIFSTSSAEVLDLELDKSTHTALFKQLGYAIAGTLLGTLVWFIGYRNIIRCSPLLFWFFVFLLVLTLIPGIGREVNGSKRWLGMAGFYFQPSEFVKYVVPAYFIHRILSFKGEHFGLQAFIKIVGVVAIPVLLILIEPNNGTAAVIGCCLVVLFFLMKMPLKFWALPLVVSICLGGLFAYQLSYVTARIQVYLHPESDLRGKGHQPYQAKIAAGSGLMWGKGAGKSWQKLSYLPEAQNDYIAAIYAEEYGFAGIFALVSVYMLLGLTGLYIAATANDRAAFCYAGVISFLISFQAFLNLGVVSGLLPSTGLNLPFFSQGGTSLMANIVGIALLLNISIENERAKKSIIV